MNSAFCCLYTKGIYSMTHLFWVSSCSPYPPKTYRLKSYVFHCIVATIQIYVFINYSNLFMWKILLSLGLYICWNNLVRLLSSQVGNLSERRNSTDVWLEFLSLQCNNYNESISYFFEELKEACKMVYLFSSCRHVVKEMERVTSLVGIGSLHSSIWCSMCCCTDWRCYSGAVQGTELGPQLNI